MNVKNIIFYVKFSFFFRYLLDNVTSVISVIVIRGYYCCLFVNCIVLFVKLLIKNQ